MNRRDFVKTLSAALAAFQLWPNVALSEEEKAQRSPQSELMISNEVFHLNSSVYPDRLGENEELSQADLRLHHRCDLAGDKCLEVVRPHAGITISTDYLSKVISLPDSLKTPLKELGGVTWTCLSVVSSIVQGVDALHCEEEWVCRYQPQLHRPDLFSAPAVG